MLWPKQGVGSQKQKLAWFQTNFNKKTYSFGSSVFLPCLNSSQRRSLDRGGFLLRGFWAQTHLYSFLIARGVPGGQGGAFGRGGFLI